MQVAVEVSMYPLTQDYEPPIIQFIQMLKAQAGLRVSTNEFSTQISGDYDQVMNTIQDAIRVSYQQPGVCTFVLKILNIEIAPGREVSL